MQYIDTDYAKYWFDGCESMEDLIERAARLAKRFEQMRNDGVTVYETDGAFFHLEYPNRAVALEYVGENGVEYMEEIYMYCEKIASANDGK